MSCRFCGFIFNNLRLVFNLLPEEITVNRHSLSARFLSALGVSALVLALGVIPAAAQTSSDDDDAKLRPAEPDYTVVNLPTTLPLPLHGSNFHLTHRFGENLRND